MIIEAMRSQLLDADADAYADILRAKLAGLVVERRIDIDAVEEEVEQVPFLHRLVSTVLERCDQSVSDEDIDDDIETEEFEAHPFTDGLWLACLALKLVADNHQEHPDLPNAVNEPGTVAEAFYRLAQDEYAPVIDDFCKVMLSKEVEDQPDDKDTAFDFYTYDPLVVVANKIGLIAANICEDPRCYYSTTYGATVFFTVFAVLTDSAIKNDQEPEIANGGSDELSKHWREFIESLP